MMQEEARSVWEGRIADTALRVEVQASGRIVALWRAKGGGDRRVVVNTVEERTTVSAVSKSKPASTSSRIRSAPRKPAWPSFMWNTSGAGSPSIAVYARMARTPPIPARISCCMRCSWSPP